MWMTDYYKQLTMDNLLKAAGTAWPSTVYLAMSTAIGAPDDDTVPSEVSGGSYVRVAITFGSNVDGTSVNTAAVAFAAPTADWGTVQSLWITDTGPSSGGKAIFGENICAHVVKNMDAAPNFPVGVIMPSLKGLLSWISNYYAEKVMDNLLKGSSNTMPASVWLAMSTVLGAPDDDSIPTEVSGGAYARKQITFASNVDGTSVNSSAVAMPAPTADWGTVQSLWIADASGSGQAIFGNNICARVVRKGDTAPSFPTGSILAAIKGA